MRNLKTALCAMAILSAPVAAQAATTYYTDLASFTAAAGATSFESFESPLTANANLVATADVSVSCGGVADCLTPNWPVPTDGDISIGAYVPLTFLFATPVRSFGLDAIGLGTAGFPTDFFVQVGGGAPIKLYTGVFGTFFDSHFAGLVSDTPFSQVTVFGTDPADFVAYDSLRYGPGQTVSAAPEPASWALLILGAGAAGAMLRRRRAAFAGA